MNSKHFSFSKNDIFIFSNVTLLLIIIISLYIIIATIRITGPSDLDDYNQGKQIIFITDIISNKNPFIHYNDQGEIFIKPPLYHLLTVINFFINHYHYTEFALKLPNLILGLFIVILLFHLSMDWFNVPTAFLSCVILILSTPFSTAIYVARSDITFTFLLLLSLSIINYTFPINQEASNKLWWLFWIVVALSLLTKGFWGFILPLLYYLFFLYSENRLKDIAVLKPIIGFIFIISLIIIWILSTYFTQTIGTDTSRLSLLSNNTLVSFKTILLNFFYGLFSPEIEPNKPEPYYILTVFYFARLFPWSIISILAIFYARSMRKKETDESHLSTFFNEENFNRVFIWFLITLVFLAFIPGKRFVMFLLPVYPAVAILSGWLISELFIYKLTTNRVYKFRSIFEGIWLIILWILIIIGLIMSFSLRKLSPELYKTINYLKIIIEEWSDTQWTIVIAGGLLLSGLSSLILIFGWAKHYRIAVTLSILNGILTLFLFYHYFSGSALTRDGESIKEFTSSISHFKPTVSLRGAKGEEAISFLEFYGNKNLPIPFLLQLNKRDLTEEQLRELSKDNTRPLNIILSSEKLNATERIIEKKLNILYESRYIYKLDSPIILASTEKTK